MVGKALWLQKDLMALAIAEAAHLVFDRWTITRPTSFYHARI